MHQYSKTHSEIDGYINATALCKAAGKLFRDYYRMDSTQDFLTFVSDKTGIPVVVGIPINGRNQALICSRLSAPYTEGETWVHPMISTHLCQWITPQAETLAQLEERKKAQLIDDHLLNNLREAFMEEIEARKDVEAELHTAPWPAGMDKDTKNYYIGAGKAAALAMKRVAKAFRGVIKGTEWEGCINILCYIEQLEREAKFANVWRKA